MEIKNVKVVHFMPGRVRLRAEELKGTPALMKEVQSAFEAVPGVRRVDVKTLTGSVLIVYDKKVISRDESTQALTKLMDKFFPTLDVSKLMAWLSSAH